MRRLSLHRAVSGCLLLVACTLCSDQSIAQPVVLESAVMGTAGRLGGVSVTTLQYVGWRFQTTQALTIDHIGGHMLSIPEKPGDIFAALVRLPSLTSVPAGAPFNTNEIVTTTTFRAPFPSAEMSTPFSATIPPGAYTLVFGTGLFGATGEGAIWNGDDQPDIPPTNLSSFIFWSPPSPGQPLLWRENLSSHMRIVIQAQVAIPGDFDHNGSVNSADYVVWRKSAGPASDYNTWRANFGRTSAGGGVSLEPTSTAVPEPSTVAGVVAVCFVGCKFARRRAVAKSNC